MVWLTPSLGGGGAERTIVNLTSAFGERGVDCTIGVLDREQAYATAARVESLRPRHVARPELWPWLGVKPLRQLERRRSADATVSFTPLANLLNARAAGSSHSRILSIRTTLSRALFGPTGRVYRHVMRRYYPRATRVIAISKFVADDAVSFLGLDPSLVQTIYNPIPIAEIERLSVERLPEPWESHLAERFTLVSTGRLSAEKGHALLLHAVADMKREGLDCRLLLLGKGARQADYSALASALGLRVAFGSDPVEGQMSADVVFVGFVANPFPFIRSGHVFAFPSALEGLGQSLLEALACGATILAADCDAGPRELLAPETDYRYRARNVEHASCGLLAPSPGVDWAAIDSRVVDEWVAALKEIRANPSRTGRACRARALDFATSPIVDAWFEALGW